MSQTMFPGFDVLLSRLVPLFQRLSGWRLWTVFTAGIILAVEIIVSGMGLLLKGTVPWDYLPADRAGRCGPRGAAGADPAQSPAR